MNYYIPFVFCIISNMITEERIQKAIELFNNKYNCAQAIFSAFSDVTGVNENISKKIPAGLGAGFGRLQNACGAVTGAILVIGSIYHNDNDITGSKELVYSKTREFIEKFQNKNNSIICRELLGVDINTTDQSQRKNLLKTRCENFLKDACSILNNNIISSTQFH